MTKKHKLRYFSGTHNYFIGRKKLTSVTTFIGKFFEPFDAKGIARKLSKFHANKVKKHGVRYWLAEWKKASRVRN